MAKSHATHQITIARRLGVSATTVSRALRNHPDLPKELRHRIVREAERIGLHFVPRKKALTFETRETSLGVIFGHRPKPGTMSATVMERLILGMKHAARLFFADLHIGHHEPEAGKVWKNQKDFPAEFKGLKLDGWIIVSPIFRGNLELLQKTGPCVRLIYHDPFTVMDCVDHNDTQAMMLQVAHLLSLGHRRIGFVTRQMGKLFEVSRHAGYVAALARHDLPYESENVVKIQHGNPDGKGNHAPEMATLLERIRLGVKAWIALHDGVGYSVTRFLKEKNIAVPGSVSVTGFDRLAPPHDLEPLTSIEAPFEAMGAAAVDRLISRLRNPRSESAHVLFDTRLVPGATTGPFSG